MTRTLRPSGTSDREVDTSPPAVALQSLEIEVTGMTCSSCSSRVERKLNKLPGVYASVNYATGLALVEMDEGIDVEALVATVEAAGYGAIAPLSVKAHETTAPGPAAESTVGIESQVAGGGERPDSATDVEAASTAELKGRLVVCAVLAAPVLLLTMLPARQFPTWQWTAFYLTTVVATWGAWPFHRAALINIRHANATMDTLISVGVLAAYLWSAWVLFWGGAGVLGYTMTFAQHQGHDPRHPHASAQGPHGHDRSRGAGWQDRPNPQGPDASGRRR